MVVLLSNHFLLPFSPISPPSRRSKLRILTSLSSSSSSSPMDQKIERHRFIDFPHLSAPHRDLMVELVSSLETTLGSQLLPPSLPPDVQYFQNDTATSRGTLYIRSGRPDSLVDYMLGSWLHCEMPSGSLDITTLTAYLKTTTDAPWFLMELMQSSPTSMILILDLPPRKDMVLHPDYLEAYYVQTQMDRLRKQLEEVPEIRPYFSSLYIRYYFSPAVISVVISCDAGNQGRVAEIIGDQVAPVAKEMLEIWLSKCARGGTLVGESEVGVLAKRDHQIRKSAVEIDLGPTLPRLFGDDVAIRVIGAIKEAYKV